jgi:hypothetical protein
VQDVLGLYGGVIAESAVTAFFAGTRPVYFLEPYLKLYFGFVFWGADFARGGACLVSTPLDLTRAD